MSESEWTSVSYLDEYGHLLKALHPLGARTTAIRNISDYELETLRGCANRMEHNERLLAILKQKSGGFTCLLEIVRDQLDSDMASRLERAQGPPLQPLQALASTSVASHDRRSQAISSTDPSSSLPTQTSEENRLPDVPLEPGESQAQRQSMSSPDLGQLDKQGSAVHELEAVRSDQAKYETAESSSAEGRRLAGTDPGFVDAQHPVDELPALDQPEDLQEVYMATAGVSLCSEIEDYTPEQLKTMVSTEINRATQSQSPSDLSPAILLVRDGSIETRTICRQTNGAARHQGQHQEQQQQQQTKVRQEVKKSDQQPQQPRRQPRHRCIRFWTAVVVVTLLAVTVGVVLKEHVCKGNCPGGIGHRQFSMTPVLHGATPVPVPEPSSTAFGSENPPTVSTSTIANHQLSMTSFDTSPLPVPEPSKTTFGSENPPTASVSTIASRQFSMTSTTTVPVPEPSSTAFGSENPPTVSTSTIANHQFSMTSSDTSHFHVSEPSSTTFGSGNPPTASASTIANRQFSMTSFDTTPVPVPEPSSTAFGSENPPTVSASTIGNHQFMFRIRVLFRTEVLYLASPSRAIVTEGGAHGSVPNVALTRNMTQALVFRLETQPNNVRPSEYGFRIWGTDNFLHRPAVPSREKPYHCLRISSSTSGQLSEKKNLLRLKRVPDDDRFENYRQPLSPLFYLISRRNDAHISACTGDNKRSAYFAIDEVH